LSIDAVLKEAHKSSGTAARTGMMAAAARRSKGPQRAFLPHIDEDMVRCDRMRDA
jgi:hypothetical protein